MTRTTTSEGAAAPAVARLYHSERIHRAAESVDALTDEHFAAFARDGFLAVENVFTPQEVAAAKERLSFLIGGGNPAYDGMTFETGVDVSGMTADQREPYVRKLMNFVAHEPQLAAMAYKPAFVAIVERIVGDKTNLIQDMALLKPAHIGREKPWHQDTAYFTYEPLELILGTWIALDEATVENGCMHVIPASHRQGPRPHYHDRDCQLPDDVVEVEKDVVVPLRPGGALFFSGLVHHGTPPNRSAARRRAVQFHYASVQCRKTDAASHGRHFHDAAGYAGCGYQAGAPPRPITERAG
jgi:phytanoyl-CoA hydroxylase